MDAAYSFAFCNQSNYIMYSLHNDYVFLWPNIKLQYLYYTNTGDTSAY